MFLTIMIPLTYYISSRAKAAKDKKIPIPTYPSIQEMYGDDTHAPTNEGIKTGPYGPNQAQGQGEIWTGDDYYIYCNEINSSRKQKRKRKRKGPELKVKRWERAIRESDEYKLNEIDTHYKRLKAVLDKLDQQATVAAVSGQNDQ